jgi:hypothetical protein
MLAGNTGQTRKEAAVSTASPPRTGNAHTATARGAEFADIISLLNRQQARKIDTIIPGSKLTVKDGMLVVADDVIDVNDEGVTRLGGTYWPTAWWDAQVADRLDIPTSYLRRLRNGREIVTERDRRRTLGPRLDLFDSNVNGLLHGNDQVPPDERNFYARLLVPDEQDEDGIAYALMSSRYWRMDHYDCVMATLEGMKRAGVDPLSLRIYGDVSESKLYLHVAAPEIITAAPELLNGYRSPFDISGEASKRKVPAYTLEERIEMGRHWRETHTVEGGIQPGSEPLVHAGFLVTNSEIGQGRWSIQKEIVVLACSNGMTSSIGQFQRRHLGSEQGEGQIEWSPETRDKELEWIISQTADIVADALNQESLETAVEALEHRAGRVVDDPQRVIKVVAQKHLFSQEEETAILRHFILGQSLTSAGVAQAISSVAQTYEDPDRAHKLTDAAIPAMEFVHAMRSTGPRASLV